MKSVIFFYKTGYYDFRCTFQGHHKEKNKKIIKRYVKSSTKITMNSLPQKPGRQIHIPAARHMVVLKSRSAECSTSSVNGGSSGDSVSTRILDSLRLPARRLCRPILSVTTKAFACTFTWKCQVLMPTSSDSFTMQIDLDATLKYYLSACLFLAPL